MDPIAFLTKESFPKSLIKEAVKTLSTEYLTYRNYPQYNKNDIKAEVINYFRTIKQITYSPLFKYEGFDFIEKENGKTIYAIIKENITTPELFEMENTEINKAKEQRKHYRIYLVYGFEGARPLYKVIDNPASMIAHGELLIAKAEYHMILAKEEPL